MRRTLLAAAALACALPLAACGGSDEIAGPPTPLASPSATASASPSAPAKETPEQFIRRWFAVAHAMATTGDTAEFEAMVDPACKSCAGFLKTTRRIYAAGGRVEETPPKIHWIHYSKLRMHGADTTYFIRETNQPSRYQEKRGGPWKQFPGGTDTQIFYLRETSTGWLMLENAQMADSYRPLSGA